MRNKMTKILKGLMVFALCFAMVFGSSMMVLAEDATTPSTTLTPTTTTPKENETTDDSKTSEVIPPVSGGVKPSSKPGSAHKHSFVWDITKEPTRTEDGEASYICYGCGHVAAKQPITRWQWYVKQYRDLVQNAEQDATVTFEADDMPCISDYMLGFHANRPDVTVVLHFTVDGVSYELTVPAGTDFSVIRDDTIGFYGYLGLAAKLGLTANVIS